ncbi:AMP-binding protein [Azospirillum sp. SYSU D00513]|uniref:AMP-binding protein n=1 Tax=Azospirillum sp. SYSU D00513 TaxID=2812561 RepID=UPI001A979D6D|nr:AMP-binding protein [Azospirillum sp. SYSU D00513]
MPTTGHIDTYVRDRLPAPQDNPDFLLEQAGLLYPQRLNAASALLDPWRERGWDGRTALIGVGADGRDDVWSYGRLRDTVDRVGRVLTEDFGIVPGNRVLLRGPNTPMLVACWLAAVKAGAVVVPTMPLLRAPELAHVLTKAAVNVALCDARYLAEMRAACDSVPGEVPALTFNGGADAGLEALLGSKPADFAPADTASDDPALILFTSGTTGTPKAAVHFHRDLLAVADLSPRSILGTTDADVFCGSTALAFAFGVGALLLFPLRAGASVVLLERWTPEALLDAMVRHRTTRLFTVPTAYRSMIALLREGYLERGRLSSLCSCVSAGEPMPVNTFEAWRDLTGQEILDSLGTTEMLNAVLHATPEGLRPGCTGKPVPGYEAMIVDDSLQPVPAGQIGRLAVRGPTGCRYLDDARQSLYVQGGWNLTGDAFHMDEDGYFWYSARTDDLIVSAGYKISGLELEDVLLRHEAVDECVVVASPDPLRGSIPKAFIVPREGVPPSEDLAEALRSYVKDRIAPYKYPRAVEFLDELPRTETGKVQRYKLRERERTSRMENAEKDWPYGT